MSPLSRPRVRGGEIEYAFLAFVKGDLVRNFFDDDTNKKILKKYLPPPLQMAKDGIMGNGTGFLTNGARLYLDSGHHPEYATPEALSAEHAAIYEKAGDSILEHIAAKVNEEYKKDNLRVRIFKNNVAHDINKQYPFERIEVSYGCHESYMLERKNETEPKNLLAPLGLFLATRQLFTGNGRFVIKKGKVAYYLSQRSHFIQENIGGGTMQGRALINTRDESHAGPNYRRLHLIVSDSNLAEAAIYLKFATTSLLLDMILEGWGPRMPTLGHEAKYFEILQNFSEDDSLTRTVPVAGEDLTMAGIQQKYLELAEEFCKETGTDRERRGTLNLWRKIVEYARNPYPYDALAPFTDWAAKKWLVINDLRKRGVSFQGNIDTMILHKNNAPRDMCYHLQAMDLQYHELGPAGLWQKMSKKGFFERMATDDEIHKAVFDPVPASTRACARAAEIRYALSKNVAMADYLDWHLPVLPAGNPVLYLDPYDWESKYTFLST